MHEEYLHAFVDKASSEVSILAAWLEGSFGKGTADRYSDIDIHLLIAEEKAATFQKHLESWLSDVQPLVFFRETFPGQMITGITTEGLRVDVWVHSGSTIRLERAKVHVLLAAEHCITFAAASRKDELPDVASTLKHHLNEFWRLLSILPTVLGRQEYIAGSMGTTFLVMSLTEVLIIGNGQQRDRGIKNINDFISQTGREAIESALAVRGMDKESIARTHLRLTGLMQRYGPEIAAQHGVAYPSRLERAVVNYLSRELEIFGLSACLNELERL